MECLPSEIVLNILLRLPVTSLPQMRLVCRAWYSITQDSFYMKIHMTEEDPCLILHSDYPARNELYLVDFSSQNEDQAVVKKFRVPAMPDFYVVCSFNGLLCLCDSLHSNALFVFNPFTRDYLELPKTDAEWNQVVVHGFGFHPSTMEYKVVKVVYTKTSRGCSMAEEYSFTKSKVQVLTLGNCASGWRSLGTIPYHLKHSSSQVLVNGRLHWVTWPDKRPQKGRLLVSFDLADEQFREVPKPDGLNKGTFHIAVLGGDLSVAAYRNGSFEIWSMKDYNLELWEKEYTIGRYMPRGLGEDVERRSYRNSRFYIDRSHIRVLCLLKNGAILLEYKHRALVSYDPKGKTFKDLTFQGMANWFETIVHVGRLTTIDKLVTI